MTSSRKIFACGTRREAVDDGQQISEIPRKSRRVSGLAQASSLPNDWLSVAVEWENMAKLADNLLVMEALGKSAAQQAKKPKAEVIQFPSKRPN